MNLSNDFCPGRYCGKIAYVVNGNTTFGECSACPSGFKTNITTKICEECYSSPTLYDWMYLGCMIMLPLTLHVFFIFLYHQEWNKVVTKQLLSVFVETCFSAFASLLLFQPQGALTIISCQVKQLSDWYTLFYNPKIRFTETVFCAQEAVYPLYSIVFIDYLFNLVTMIFLRSLCKVKCNKANKKKIQKSVFAALYFYPFVIVIHAVAAGLIYYSYPYLMVIGTIVAFVVYCVRWNAMSIKKIIEGPAVQHISIMVWHLLLLTYTVIAIGSKDLSFFSVSILPYIAVVPVPFVFFFLTEQFTDPRRIEAEIS